MIIRLFEFEFRLLSQKLILKFEFTYLNIKCHFMTNLEAEVGLAVEVKKFLIILETMKGHRQLKVLFNDFQTFNRP